MKPLLMVAIFFTLGSFFFSNNILPYTNLKFTSLLFSVKQQRPELQIKEGVFYDGIEGYTIKVDKKEDETGLLRNVMIYDHSAKNGGNKSVTTADSGYIKITKNQQYLIITLYDGYTYEDVKEDNKSNRHPFRSNSFKEQEVVFELTGYGFERTDEELFKNQAKMLTMDQLQVIIDSLDRERNERALGQVRSFVYSSNFSHSSEINKLKDEPRPYPLNLDSLMQSVNSDQRYSTASDAVRRAKEARSTFVNLTDNVKYINREVKLHEIEWHRKFSFSLSCLIFFFIGAPLGAIIRKGGIGTPFVISLALFLLYYIISMSCERLAKNGNWDPAIAMWMSTLLILPLGIFFTYKAVKDQTFVMPKWYTKLINSYKFFNFK
jgi:lipopolysaccharide export system permease protein